MEINLHTSRDQSFFKKFFLKNYPVHNIELTIEASVSLSETGNQQNTQDIKIKYVIFPFSVLARKVYTAIAAGANNS